MSAPPAARLGLRAGDVVEVRSRDEILATLSADGCLDALPFMPEMLAFCGQRLTVDKRADKTCDTITWDGLRRMTDCVHLAGSRCAGSAHGGCEAACTLFWKEAWLRRVTPGEAPGAGTGGPLPAGRCTMESLNAATVRERGATEADTCYRCQATDLVKATTKLSSWDLRQYARDVWSGNASVAATFRGILWHVLKHGRMKWPGYRLQLWLYDAVQRLRGGRPFPHLDGPSAETPKETLGLVPGDLVQVKSIEEIRKTLNPVQKNRGLYFDIEETPYCGGTYRVRSRVTRFIEETTGRMKPLRGDCILLEGVVCTGRYHKNCPRAIPAWWREIWLRRVTSDPTGPSSFQV